MSDEEILNWAMNQLYRAARVMQIAEKGLINYCNIQITGCDITAEYILKRLKQTKSGRNLVKETNPKLLKQKCPAKIKKLLKEYENLI